MLRFRTVRESLTSTKVVGAANGHEDYLFRYHLHHYGMSGTGTISSTGTDRRGKSVKLEREPVSQESVLEHEAKTVQNAINSKLKTQEHYPPKTALIISFDDTFAFDRADNISNLKTVLDANATKLSRFNFSWVAIIGLQKGLFMERKTG